MKKTIEEFIEEYQSNLDYMGVPKTHLCSCWYSDLLKKYMPKLIEELSPLNNKET